MRRLTIAALPWLVVLAAACGGSSNGPATFVAHDAHDAVLIQWTRDGGDLKGSLTIAHTDASTATELQHATVPFTGIVNGTSVTLTLDRGLGSSTNWTGTLDGKNLRLTYTQNDGSVAEVDLVAGAVADYNKSLAALRAQVVAAKRRQAQQEAAAAAAAQTQQAQQQLDTDAQAVASDLSSVQQASSTVAGESFAPDLSTMRGDLQTTHHDLQTVLSDAADSVCADAGTVDADEGTIEADQGTIEADIGSVEADISSLQQEVSALQQDYQRYQRDAQGAPSYTPPNAPEPQTVNSTLAGAKTATKTARSAESAGRAAAASLVRQGKQYAAKADARCTARG